MKNLCFYFQVHQPYRLKKYRFFNIGKDHFYYDDYLNRIIIERISSDCYLPMNNLLLDISSKYGDKFKVTFSLTGTVVEQLHEYTPKVIGSFRSLVDTGNVELLSETYGHTLSSLNNEAEFTYQVHSHKKMLLDTFSYEPTTFRNTELIYSDSIGELIGGLGYSGILTEGTKHSLGSMSSNYVYHNTISHKIKLLLRNFILSDDLSFRFGQGGMTPRSYYDSLVQQQGDSINLFMDYETFGEHIKSDSGIFFFMEELFDLICRGDDFIMSTPSSIFSSCSSVSSLAVPHPISWADEERDLSAWLGNDLQDEAIRQLYSLRDLYLCNHTPHQSHVWNTLQSSDHFYYMCTKWFSDGDIHDYFNPYDSPYDAFVNYMNVLADFKMDLERSRALGEQLG